MKTTSYNAEKEIRVGILVAVFALSIFTAVRVKELQLNDATYSNETRSSQILTKNANTPPMPILDARLIDEPVEVASLMKSIEYKASEYVKAEIAAESQRFLNSNNEAIEAEQALTVEPWMTVNEYKAADFVNAEMAIEAERFLNRNDEVVETEAALAIEPWMTANEYKAADFVNAEMTSETERFLNNNNVAVEAEPALAIEAWMTAIEYKATDFVNIEMAGETERFLNNNNEAIEAGTTESESTLANE